MNAYIHIYCTYVKSIRTQKGPHIQYTVDTGEYTPTYQCTGLCKRVFLASYSIVRGCDVCGMERLETITVVSAVGALGEMLAMLGKEKAMEEKEKDGEKEKGD